MGVIVVKIHLKCPAKIVLAPKISKLEAYRKCFAGQDRQVDRTDRWIGLTGG